MVKSSRASRSCWPCSAPPRAGRAPSASRSPNATTARSSTAIRRRSTAASTSAPTRSTLGRGAASRTISSTSPTRPRSTRRRSSLGRGSRPFATSTRAAGCRFSWRHGFYYRALTRGPVPRARGRRHCAPVSTGSPKTRRRAPARPARAYGRRLGRAHHAARPQAPRAGARGLLLDRAAADRAFDNTRSLIPTVEVVAVALRLPPALTAERVARRVDKQFARGIVDEVRGLLARGVPAQARPFGGLVYRQVMEMLRGVRGRGRDARAHRAGEPPLRATAVDLVPQRA